MALNDRQHVEAVGLLRMIVEQTNEMGFVLPEILRGAERWLEENHPEPSTYMAALSDLAVDERKSA